MSDIRVGGNHSNDMNAGLLFMSEYFQAAPSGKMLHAYDPCRPVLARSGMCRQSGVLFWVHRRYVQTARCHAVLKAASSFMRTLFV